MSENQLQRFESYRFVAKPLSVLFLLLVLFAPAQTTPAQSQSNPPAQQSSQSASPSPTGPSQPSSQASAPPGTTQVPGAGVDVQNQQQGSAASSSQQPESKTRITKAQ